MTENKGSAKGAGEAAKYKTKPVAVEAFQLTFENQAEVKAWCGGKTWSRPPMRAVTGISLGVNFNVPFGHYIFKDEEGTFHYCAPDVFENRYEPASHPVQSGKQGQAEERYVKELMKDPFIKKHLDRIWELTKKAKIDIYIKPMFGSLRAESIRYFLETGTINGNFYQALDEMMDSIRNIQPQPLPSPQTAGAVCPICSNEMKPQMRCDNCRYTFDVSDLENKSCDKSCGPGDYRKGGKCDENGCYESSGVKDSERDVEIELLKAAVLKTDYREELERENKDMKQEIERLKGLIEKMWFSRFPYPERAKEHMADQFEQFKFENNL